jgi:hypothetical protein
LLNIFWCFKLFIHFEGWALGLIINAFSLVSQSQFSNTQRAKIRNNIYLFLLETTSPCPSSVHFKKKPTKQARIKPRTNRVRVVSEVAVRARRGACYERARVSPHQGQRHVQAQIGTLHTQPKAHSFARHILRLLLFAVPIGLSMQK